MYICLCSNVTDKQIKETIAKQPSCRMRDLHQCLGVGKQCGKCLCHAKQILNDINKKSLTMQS